MATKRSQHGREVGARIKDSRLVCGMSQKDLAQQLEVTDRSVQMYEQGYTIPLRHIRQISELVGRSTGWLLYGVEDDVTRDGQFDALMSEVQAVASELRSLRTELRRVQDMLGRLAPA